MANLVQQYLLQQQAGLLAQERQMMEQALMAQMYAQRDAAAAVRQAERDAEAYRRAELMQQGMEQRQTAQAKVASDRQTTHDRDMMDRQAQFLREKDASDMFERTAEPRLPGESADTYIARMTPIRKERTQQAMAEYIAEVEASKGRMGDLWKRMDQETKKESDLLYAASAGKINETIEMRAGMLPNAEDLMKKAAAKKQTLAQYLADKAHPLVDEVQSEFRAKAQNDAAAKASPELRYQWQEEYKNAENSRAALKQFKMQNSAWLPMSATTAAKPAAGTSKPKTAAAPAADEAEAAASAITEAVTNTVPAPTPRSARQFSTPEDKPVNDAAVVPPPAPGQTQPYAGPGATAFGTKSPVQSFMDWIDTGFETRPIPSTFMAPKPAPTAPMFNGPPVPPGNPAFVGPMPGFVYPGINPDLSGALGPVVPMPQPVPSRRVDLSAEWAKTPEQFGLGAFRRWLNQQRTPTPTGMVEPPALEIPPPPRVQRSAPPGPDAMAWMITYGTPEQKAAVRATYAPPFIPEPGFQGAPHQSLPFGNGSNQMLIP